MEMPKDDPSSPSVFGVSASLKIPEVSKRSVLGQLWELMGAWEEASIGGLCCWEDLYGTQ